MSREHAQFVNQYSLRENVCVFLFGKKLNSLQLFPVFNKERIKTNQSVFSNFAHTAFSLEKGNAATWDIEKDRNFMGIYRLASICGDGGLVEDLSSLKIG